MSAPPPLIPGIPVADGASSAGPAPGTSVVWAKENCPPGKWFQLPTKAVIKILSYSGDGPAFICEFASGWLDIPTVDTIKTQLKIIRRALPIKNPDGTEVMAIALETPVINALAPKADGEVEEVAPVAEAAIPGGIPGDEIPGDEPLGFAGAPESLPPATPVAEPVSDDGPEEDEEEEATPAEVAAPAVQKCQTHKKFKGMGVPKETDCAECWAYYRAISPEKYAASIAEMGQASAAPAESPAEVPAVTPSPAPPKAQAPPRMAKESTTTVSVRVKGGSIFPVPVFDLLEGLVQLIHQLCQRVEVLEKFKDDFEWEKK